ncbi:hypothetical protein KUL25_20305 [Rhodobacteraceae bacterium N5(2021)]|uniref:Uncharacterized protein n=1 Tax=Gymnodinialimonas phycosphaerae TaxID=2841589 RepID=A0A975YFS5_9RHOB|nr:hypothetical protein [Gymnodinialimonas phycosphaerae]MBY4895110.1 hypothetical protein [Gymnodinialimonas phycosphaerae]
MGTSRDDTRNLALAITPLPDVARAANVSPYACGTQKRERNQAALRRPK